MADRHQGAAALTRPVAGPAALGPLRLASASPRRRELLAAAGWRFTVAAVDVDESPRPGEAPRSLCERLAREKAAAGAAEAENGWVLAGDTVVIVDGEGLGKPDDREAAATMLGRLSGKEHEVASAVAVLHPSSGLLLSEVATSRVAFDRLDAGALAAYLDGGEWQGKAGGYAIQGEAGRFARVVSGETDTVIGLPVATAARLAHELASRVGAAGGSLAERRGSGGGGPTR